MIGGSWRMTAEQRFRARYREEAPPSRDEQPAPEHAIRTLHAERAPDSRSFLLSVKCLCGSEYIGIPVAELTGVLDVGLQLFFSHLGAAGQVGESAG